LTFVNDLLKYPVNIGLGNGKALETFNNNILSFKAVGQKSGTIGGQTVTNTTQP
jgi:hypothetical protein